jgi:hypothetical protein
MAFTPVKIAYLISEIEKEPPKRVLDVGSGSRTIVLELLAEKYGFDGVSIEKFDESANYVRSMLQKNGAQDRVKLFMTPLARISCPNGKKYWWYDLDWSQAGDGFDYVVVDGPMSLLVGRNGALPQMQPHLAPQRRIYMDDARRKHEQSCVVEWKRYFPSVQTEVPATCPGWSSSGLTLRVPSSLSDFPGCVPTNHLLKPRYEDLTKSPEASGRDLWEGLSLRCESSNDSRFRSGADTKVDERWKHCLPDRQLQWFKSTVGRVNAGSGSIRPSAVKHELI